VHVGVLEAGQHDSAGQVDDVCPRTDLRGQDLVPGHRDDAAVGNGEPVTGEVVVTVEDMAVPEDQ
jgi:hypothetical protein